MFASETHMGTPPDSPDRVVDPALAAGRLWVWDDGGPVAMARHTAVVAGVSRVGWVFTPPARRGRGYARACVGHLSAHLHARHVAVVLYADLANPTSNRLYQRLGYEAVAEVLHYRFG
jgi:predicted GNAT family acetyltransferase